MFVGRDRELAALNNLHAENKFQLVIMYGRRRVGKTTLINEFCKEKNHIFFVAQEHNEKAALEELSNIVLEKYDEKDDRENFGSWDKLFRFLSKKAQGEQLIVVIDEFPYLARANKSLPSILQNVIDHNLKDSKLFIILCGSSISFMEKEVLSYKSPLYGRRTAQMKVEPFDFFDSMLLLKNYDIEDKIYTYSVLGGIPLYLTQFDDTVAFEENLKKRILNKISYLFEEPKNLLKQELREPMVYNDIIEAIANGSSKMNEIATRAKVPADQCSKYLNTLLELGILSRETPVTESGSGRKSIYKIKDNLFRFWYRFVFENITSLELDLTDEVYNENIKPYLDLFTGHIFEEICRQFLLQKLYKKELPFVFNKIGGWWGGNPKLRTQEEIDIVAISRGKALFCECKWRKDKTGTDVLDNLIRKSELLDYEERYYALFSKAGFTEELIKKADGNVLLFSLNDFENFKEGLRPSPSQGPS